MVKKLVKIVDVTFLTRFILLFIPLYYFHILFRGITDPKNLYSPFLDRHLNYISSFENSILYCSSLIVQANNLNSHIVGKVIAVSGGSSVIFWPECAGLGIISFWIAFVLSHDLTLKSKFAWCSLGVFTIWVINTFRIAILLIALERQWKANPYIDHHDMFNIVAYFFVIFLIKIFKGRINKNVIAER
jgi:exosortase/archaeosortase family protein